MRRTRLKPTAILQPRRQPSRAGSIDGAATTKSIDIKQENELKTEKQDHSLNVASSNGDTKETEFVDQLPDSIKCSDIKSEKKSLTQNPIQSIENASIESKGDEIECTESKLPESKPKPIRRMIKPPVCLPLDRNRKRNSVKSTDVAIKETKVEDTVIEPKSDPIAIENEPVVDQEPEPEQKSDSIYDDSVEQAPPTPDAYVDSKQKDLPDADNFKSPPFMSPSMQSSQQKMWQSKDLSTFTEDMMPLSPAKVRQRIRPTPCFAARRNSIQGMDTDEDSSRRQRHLSTSSSHSNYNPSGYINRAVLGLGRIRTESNCSNISDLNAVREITAKAKSQHRSDAFKKIANTRREMQARFNGDKPDKNRLKMFDLIYYNPMTNPMTNPAKTSDVNERRASTCSQVSSVKLENVKRENVSTVKMELDDPEPEVAAPVPQLKLGPDGEIILDEQSLVIETTRKQEAREVLANSSLIYDDEFSGSSGFYKRTKRTREWPPEETIKFYRSLHTVGTDFSLMMQLFPNRSRRDLKLKFKREEKLNLSLINKALLHPKEFNIDELKSEFETEEKELERLKAEWKELKVARAKEKKEAMTVAKKKTSKKVLRGAARVLADPTDTVDYEFTKPPTRRRKKNIDANVEDSENQSIKDTKQTSINSPQNVNGYKIHFDEDAASPIASNNSPPLNEPSSPRMECDSYLIQQQQQQQQQLDRYEMIQSPIAPIKQINSVENLLDLSIRKIENNQPSILSEAQLISEISLTNINPLYNYNSIYVEPTPDPNDLNNPFEQITTTGTGTETATTTTTTMELISNNTQMNQNIETIDEHTSIYSDQTDDRQLVIDFDYINSESNEINNSVEITITSNCAETNMDYINEHESNESNSNNNNNNNVLNVKSNEIKSVSELPIEHLSIESNDETISCGGQIHSCIDNNNQITNDVKILNNEFVQNTNFNVESFKNEMDNVDNDDNDYNHDNDDNDDNNDNNDDGDDDLDELNNLRDSLVVVASEDPNDSSKVIHEVFLISPITGELSDEPLELPPDIVERIVATLRPT